MTQTIRLSAQLAFALSLTAALALPREVEACLFLSKVSEGTVGMQVTAARMIFTELDGRRELAMQPRLKMNISAQHEADDRLIAWVVPLPAGWGPGNASKIPDLISSLSKLQEVSAPVALRSASGGCGRGTPLHERERDLEGWPGMGRDWSLDEAPVSTVAEVEAWAAARGYLLSEADLEDLGRREAAGEGFWPLELTVTWSDRGIPHPVPVALPEGVDPLVPLSLFSSCWGQGAVLLVYHVGEEGVVPAEIETLAVDDEELRALAHTADLGVAERSLASSRGDLVAFLEYSNLPGRGIEWLPIGGRPGSQWLTRLRLLPSPGQLPPSLTLVLDEGRGPVTGIVDLRPSPYGHGAALGSTPLQLVAGLALMMLWRRARR